MHIEIGQPRKAPPSAPLVEITKDDGWARLKCRQALAYRMILLHAGSRHQTQMHRHNAQNLASTLDIGKHSPPWLNSRQIQNFSFQTTRIRSKQDGITMPTQTDIAFAD